MGTERTRTRRRRVSSLGTADLWYNDNVITHWGSSSVPLDNEFCRDWIGDLRPYPDHPLYLEKKEVKQVVANGTIDINWNGAYMLYQNYRWLRSDAGNCPLPPVPDWVDYKNRALISLSPNIPPVDVANFIFELRELPRLLQSLGKWIRRDIKPSDVPSEFLGWHFGWKPLINDIMGLLQFAESWEKRLRVLYRAGRKGHYRGKLLNESEITSLTSLYIQVSIRQGTVLRKLLTELEVWFTVSLDPKDTKGLPTYEEKFVNQFLKPILSSSNPLASVWNSLPWTWMIDYFGTIGSWIEASGGRLPYDVIDMNIMFHSIDTEIFEPSGILTSAWSNGYNRTETKQRTIHSSPTPSIWYKHALTAHQKNILLALTTTKLLGKSSGVNG